MNIDKILTIDVETTGFSKGDDVAHNHQILSIGLIVSDGDFNVVDKMYCEIKWNGTSHWSAQAEKIHKLTKEYLEENGVDEEDAVEKIATFILTHYDPDEPIVFLGHNARNFDIKFFEKLTNKFGIHFKVAHRTVDSFGVGFVCLGANNSDELFDMFYPSRKAHNALEDAEMALGVCKKLRMIMDSIL